METKEELDTLGRNEIIDKIISIIESVSFTKGNTSFALDGEWGMGKSFVLDKVEKKLESIRDGETSADKYFVIHYNCWQYDFYDEPLMAIVSSLIETLNEEKFIKDPKQREIFKNVFKKIGVALLSIVNGSIKKTTGIDIKQSVQDTNEIFFESDQFVKEQNSYDSYFQFKQLLKQLREEITKLSEKQTIVFVIDELDRCLPEYTIKVLERLHHVFEGISNSILIVGTDKSKLKNMIESLFGYTENVSSEYLKKFIKFSIPLDVGKINNDIKKKYNVLLEKYSNDIFDSDKFDIVSLFEILFNNINIREQENLLNQCDMVHSLITNEKLDISVLYVEIILIVFEKYHKIPLEKFFQNGDFDASNTICKEKADMLQKLFVTNGITRRDFDNKYYLVYGKDSGVKGVVLWYLECLRNRCRLEGEGFHFVRYDSSNKTLFDSLENNVEILYKYTKFIDTIS